MHTESSSWSQVNYQQSSKRSPTFTFPPLQPCTHCCSPPCMPHAPPISSSLIWSTEQYSVRNIYHEAPHTNFTSLLPLPPASASYFKTVSRYVRHLLGKTKFHKTNNSCVCLISMHSDIKREDKIQNLMAATFPLI